MRVLVRFAGPGAAEKEHLARQALQTGFQTLRVHGWLMVDLHHTAGHGFEIVQAVMNPLHGVTAGPRNQAPELPPPSSYTEEVRRVLTKAGLIVPV
jgi:hypothetical protein